MKLKPIITHVTIFTLGSILTASYFVMSVIPSTSKYIYSTEVHNIELPKKDSPTPYAEILQKRYLSYLYGASPYYFFKRQESKNITKTLAELGYWPAVDDIFGYHHWRADDPRLNEAQHKYHFEEALNWAEYAAKGGYQIPMLLMITRLNLAKHQNIAQELHDVEDYVKGSSFNGPARMLAKYFGEQNKSEKEQFYQSLEKQIAKENRPEPACTTIPPWKGW
ncbi:MAG: hypothetical protein CMF62_06965 [Magnetococcales bacterium]|nr:hypothetical protein [Magnetococcales bacterium]